MIAILERDDRPAFRWDQAMTATKLAAVRHRHGRLVGRIEWLGFDLRNEGDAVNFWLLTGTV